MAGIDHHGRSKIPLLEDEIPNMSCRPLYFAHLGSLPQCHVRGFEKILVPAASEVVWGNAGGFEVDKIS